MDIIGLGPAAAAQCFVLVLAARVAYNFAHDYKKLVMLVPGPTSFVFVPKQIACRNLVANMCMMLCNSPLRTEPPPVASAYIIYLRHSDALSHRRKSQLAS